MSEMGGAVGRNPKAGGEDRPKGRGEGREKLKN